MPASRPRPAAPANARVAWWNDRRVRGVLYQVLVLGGVVLLAAYLISNTLTNLAARNIATGFGFLGREAGFGVSESLIDYSPADSYVVVLIVGLLNTLKVSVIGIILATIIGTLFGIARLSRNWLVARFATVYVEGLRNIPVLLQLFFWYSLITEALPGPREALNPLPGVFVSARGLKLPEPVWQTTHLWMGAAFLAGIAAAWAIGRWARQRRERTGQLFPTGKVGAGLILGLPTLVWLLAGAPTAMNIPELRGFNFAGGLTVTPEFTALLVGLVLYTGTFIAEIVRGGILAVAHGQTEAALALGLSRGQVLRLI
ncbi:MAG TPA: ABC transporter permease subunit, partial [Rhodospirillales bacterium]|nr:ABC transporter permease subunit [Rhodospirillales bacterium]